MPSLLCQHLSEMELSWNFANTINFWDLFDIHKCDRVLNFVLNTSKR